MVGLEVVFWTCFLLVAHTYLLYPVSLFVACTLIADLVIAALDPRVRGSL